MGAWGPGVFENDVASDFLHNLETRGLLTLTAGIAHLKQKIGKRELENDEVDLARAIAATCLAGRGIRSKNVLAQCELSDVCKAQCSVIDADILADAKRLMEKTLESSEPRELWSEAGMWKQWSDCAKSMIRDLSREIDRELKGNQSAPFRPSHRR